METLTEKVLKIAQPFLDSMSLELVELNLGRYKTQLTIQILADKLNGGITIEECTKLNRQIGEVLETEDVIAGHYVLEVSSPGLDRPLKTAKDFQRNLNRPVRCFLLEPVEGRIEHEGIIKRIEGDSVIIDGKSKEIMIPIIKLNKAKLIIEI